MENQYDKYIQKILQNEIFANSPKSKDLFIYLLKCNEQGTPVKEIQIAADVFQRDLSEGDQESTIVRVNIHNLRKKLKHYYLTEGKNDEIQFGMPVGRYHVEIVNKTLGQTAIATINKHLIYKNIFAYLSFVLAILLMSFFFIYKS